MGDPPLRLIGYTIPPSGPFVLTPPRIAVLSRLYPIPEEGPMADDSTQDHDETPGTAMIERPASTALMTPEQFDSTWRMSKALASSGTFKDIGREDGSKALARIMLGADLGMSPTQALMGIDIVKGNPQIRGVALGRMVRLTAKRPTPSGESYDYAVLDRGFEKDKEYATVALYRRDEDGRWPIVEAEEGETFPTIAGPVTIKRGKRLPEAVEAFVLDQAKKRGLIKTDGAWETQPEVMCVWRALSQLVRFYAPDVIGGMPVYTEADGLRETRPGAGAGSGEAPEWRGLSPEQIERAETVFAMARERGHAGLADPVRRMELNGQPADVIDARLSAWMAELDAMPVIADAEVVTDEPLPDDPAVLEAAALNLMNRADALEAEGETEMAGQAQERASMLHARATELRGEQGTLDGFTE
jgi:hypothetical protein